jgi:DinB superfamily
MRFITMAKTAVMPASLILLSITLTAQSRPAPTTPQSVRAHFASVNRKVLNMVKDFPEDKYSFRLKPEMRSFNEMIVHIASGNVYAAKAGRGEKVNWDELDPKNYANKASVVALMEKSIADADATLKGVSDEVLAKNAEPWLGVMEHSAEHYGLLVGYYRANGLVPPESRGAAH